MPILVADATALNEWLQPVAGQPGVFTARGVLRRPDNPQAAADVTFAPFYRLHRQPSFAYVDLLSNEQWTTRLANLEAERRQQRLEEATLGFADAGEMQAERDYNYQSSESRPVEEMGVRHGRAGTGWFSFDLPVNPSGPTALLITFHGQTQANASFEVLVDGTRVATQSILNPSATDFYDAEVAIPANLTQGKERVTVRFQATGSGRIPTVYGLRTIRADAPR